MKLLALFTLLVVGCASMPDPVTPVTSVADPRLRAALPFKADGVGYVGTALLPRRPGVGTKFQIDLPKDTLIIFINSCARELTVTPTASSFEYLYQAGMWKETAGSCMLTFTAITKSGEFHKAIIDFTNSLGRDMPAEMFCNGNWVTLADGAAICQVHAGLPVSVKFTAPTIYSHRPECNEPKCVAGCSTVNEVKIGTEFDIGTTEGFCGYDFNNKANQIFRLTTVGYTSVLNLFPPLKGQ